MHYSTDYIMIIYVIHTVIEILLISTILRSIEAFLIIFYLALMQCIILFIILLRTCETPSIKTRFVLVATAQSWLRTDSVLTFESQTVGLSPTLCCDSNMLENTIINLLNLKCLVLLYYQHVM